MFRIASNIGSMTSWASRNYRYQATSAGHIVFDELQQLRGTKDAWGLTQRVYLW
jgi:hypothetical protein